MSDGYQSALEAAGAKVIAFGSFGSYQGDWVAFVEYGGKRGWISDYYGSCSGCDAFEGAFNYETPTPEQLAAFGKDYLEGGLLTNDAMLARASRHSHYSLEDDEMHQWVRKTIEAHP